MCVCVCVCIGQEHQIFDGDRARCLGRTLMIGRALVVRQLNKLECLHTHEAGIISKQDSGKTPFRTLDGQYSGEDYEGLPTMVLNQKQQQYIKHRLSW